VARTVVNPQACCSAVRPALLLAVVSGMCLGVLFWITPDAALAASGGCPPVETAVASSPEHVEEDVELQRVLDEKQGSGEGGPASPNEEPVVAELEAEFGSQYGSVWYESEPNVRFVVGLASGKIDISEAEEKLRQILARQVAPQNLAFAEARSQVRAVPYTSDELKVALESIRGELMQIGAATVSTGLGGGSGSLEWPRVGVTFEVNATTAECEAVESMLAKYGSEIAFSRYGGPVVATGGEGLPIGSISKGLPDTKGSAQSPNVSRPTNRRAGGMSAALRELMRSLQRRTYVATEARMTVTLPANGRVVVRIWMLTGRVRRLIADGATWAHAGNGEVIVLVKPTALGQRLRGKELHRIMVGEVRLLSKRGNARLAQTDLAQ
jgi:hypothetical protein